MRAIVLLLAGLMLNPVVLAGTQDERLAVASEPLAGATTASAPHIMPGLDLPYVVDEAGDTIEGDLVVAGAFTVTGPATFAGAVAVPGGDGIRFDGGRLAAQDALTFDGVPVCLAGSVLDGCRLALEDGSVTLAKLAFDPATQGELDSHMGSGDHDARYATRAELGAGAGVNDGTNPVAWAALKGVPAGFADGSDDDTDTTYSAGTGLVLSGTTFSADTSVVQQRVASSCAVGSSIRAIAGDGSVSCEVDTDTDTDTTYSAGEGLALGGTTFSIADGGVTTAKLAADSVTAAKVAFPWAKGDAEGGAATDLNCNACVHNGDLAGQVVGTGNLIDGAVTSAKLAAGAVQSSDLADGSVGTAKLAFDPATQGELDGHKGSSDHDGRYYTESEADGRFVRIGQAAGGDLQGTYPNPTLREAVLSGYDQLVSSRSSAEFPFTNAGTPGVLGRGGVLNQPSPHIVPGQVGEQAGFLPVGTQVEVAALVRNGFQASSGQNTVVSFESNTGLLYRGGADPQHPQQSRFQYYRASDLTVQEVALRTEADGAVVLWEFIWTVQGAHADASWREMDVTVKADGQTLVTLTDVAFITSNRLVDGIGNSCGGSAACGGLMATPWGRITMP